MNNRTVILVNPAHQDEQAVNFFFIHECQKILRSKIKAKILASKDASQIKLFFFLEAHLSLIRDPHYNFGWSSRDPDTLQTFGTNLKKAMGEYSTVLGLIHFCESEVEKLSQTLGIRLVEKLDDKIKYYILMQ